MYAVSSKPQLGQTSPQQGQLCRPRRQRSVQPPAAFFQTLFRRAEPEPQLPGGLVEKPLYRPSEMVQMGPFKVSPMGFGTCSWVSGPLLCYLVCAADLKSSTLGVCN